MSHILVTGSSGFAGQTMVRMLLENGYAVRAAYRGHLPVTNKQNEIEWVKYNLEDEDNNYSELLDGVETVIHMAGLAHVTDRNAQSLELFRKINVEGTRKLASEAAGRGIKRFVFVSTVKVHGEKSNSTSDGLIQPFTEKDIPAPQGPYATSKLEAEQVIKDICSNTRMQYIILRPPLIYGPHVKANFLRLVDLAAKGIPSPLASIINRRSLIYVDNLAGAILTAIEKPEAANNTYLVSDTDVSLPQLVKEIAKHLGKKTILYPFPVSLLRVAGILTGRKEVIDRLTESLLVDSSKIRNDLQWEPKVTFEEGIKATVEWYKRL